MSQIPQEETDPASIGGIPETDLQPLENNNLERQLEHYKTRVQDLERDKASLEAEGLKLNDIIKAKEGECASLRSEAQALSNRVSQQQIEIEQLQSDLEIKKVTYEDKAEMLKHQYEEESQSLRHILEETEREARRTIENVNNERLRLMDQLRMYTGNVQYSLPPPRFPNSQQSLPPGFGPNFSQDAVPPQSLPPGRPPPPHFQSQVTHPQNQPQFQSYPQHSPPIQPSHASPSHSAHAQAQAQALAQAQAQAQQQPPRRSQQPPFLPPSLPPQAGSIPQRALVEQGGLPHPAHLHTQLGPESHLPHIPSPLRTPDRATAGPDGAALDPARLASRLNKLQDRERELDNLNRAKDEQLQAIKEKLREAYTAIDTLRAALELANAQAPLAQPLNTSAQGSPGVAPSDSSHIPNNTLDHDDLQRLRRNLATERSVNLQLRKLCTSILSSSTSLFDLNSKNTGHSASKPNPGPVPPVAHASATKTQPENLTTTASVTSATSKATLGRSRERRSLSIPNLNDLPEAVAQGQTNASSSSCSSDHSSPRIDLEQRQARTTENASAANVLEQQANSSSQPRERKTTTSVLKDNDTHEQGQGQTSGPKSESATNATSNAQAQAQAQPNPEQLVQPDTGEVTRQKSHSQPPLPSQVSSEKEKGTGSGLNAATFLLGKGKLNLPAAKQRIVSEREWENLQLELERAKKSRQQLEFEIQQVNARGCLRCNNYERELQSTQSKLRGTEHLLQESTNQVGQLNKTTEELQQQIRVLEENLQKKNEFIQSKIQELQTQASECAKQLSEAKRNFASSRTHLERRLEEVFMEREKVSIEIHKLRSANDFLMCRREQLFVDLQAQNINLPETPVDCHSLLLKYLQEMAMLKSVAEHIQQNSISELKIARDQYERLREKSTAKERQLTGQIQLLEEEVAKDNSLSSALDNERKRGQEFQTKAIKIYEELKQQALRFGQERTRWLASEKVASDETQKLREELTNLRQRVQHMQSELSNSESVQHDFVKLSQSLQIELEKIRESDSEVRWQFKEDALACYSCTSPFMPRTKMCRCHHCCKLFCEACCTKILAVGPSRRVARVCSVCHTLLNKQAKPYFSLNAPGSLAAAGPASATSTLNASPSATETLASAPR